MINEENFKIWTDALRSGEFEQGVGYLHETTEIGDEDFCCVGVACVKANLEREVESVEDHRRGADITLYAYEGSTGEAPDGLYNWLGLDRASEGHEGFFNSLYTMNDTHRCSFEEIADAIDAMVESGYIEPIG